MSAIEPYITLNDDYYFLHNNRWTEVKPKALLSLLTAAGVQDDEIDAMFKGGKIPVAGTIGMFPPDVTPIVRRNGMEQLNTYRGIPVPTTGPCDPSQWPAIYDLFTHLFSDPAEQAWVLEWLAAPIQALNNHQPPRRCKSALVLFGMPGSGKGFLARVLRGIYGAHFITFGQRALESEFPPEQLANTLFFVADEVKVESTVTMDTMKAWITEPTITINVKYKPQRIIDAHFNAMITCNHERPIRLEGDDRRYTTIAVRKPLPQSIATALEIEERAGWPSLPAFIAYLNTIAVRHGSIEPLHNITRHDQILLSESAAKRFARELLDVGLDAIAANWVHAIAKSEGHDLGPWYTTTPNNTATVSIARFAQLFRYWCSVHNVVSSTTTLIDEIRTIIPTVARADQNGNALRAYIGGKQQRAVVGIPLHPAGASPTTTANTTTAATTTTQPPWN